MTLSPMEITFLQGLVAAPRDTRRDSKVAQFFALHYGIGQQVGRRFEYTENDVASAKELMLALGLNSNGTAAEGLDRADSVGRPGLGEKVSTIAPHTDSVAFMVLGSSARASWGSQEPTPVGYSVATIQEVGQIEVDRVLVVENAETFRQIRRYRWILQALPPQSSTLVLFRGDPRLRIDEAAQALQLLNAPKWAFFDFDPAGLAMAAAISNLERLLLPDPVVLQALVLHHRRTDLWATQYQGVWQVLEGCRHPDISRAWGLLKLWKYGYPQEWMRDL